ncbi:MAG: ABC transporter substrate-binding protein [Anaerolineales bacterium]|nr:ABC transporter substrate-binding protein [Chloroflexota bacterium]MBL6979735.1 ABC transporter substrate-binding protein [Anaerolineales bacterium]
MATIRRLSVFFIILISSSVLSGCISQPAALTEVPLDSVTLQLQWVTQAQFAGYYVALDKGWYLDEGIDLTIKPGGPDISPADSVAGGTAEFGTSLLADIIVAIQQGKPIISVGQIQQINGLLLLAKKTSGIETPQDLAGKDVGVWLGSWQAQFDALMAKEGFTANDFNLVSQGFSMDSFLNDELDVASAMIYNEYYVVLENGFSPEDINIIDYADYGLGFPGDVLMTNTQLVEQNPDLVTRMLRASLRGWQYAVENPEETVDIVLKYDKPGIQTREHQLSMMNEIAKLVKVTVRPLGFTDRSDIRATINTLANFGILDEAIEPEIVFTNDFWDQANSTTE